VHHFDVDPGRKANLLEGLDEIGASLTSADEISAFETKRRLMTPWLEPAN
jgi:3-isopropylmalate/(R)-2-methylmalate dehydratase small subunit